MQSTTQDLFTSQPSFQTIRTSNTELMVNKVIALSIETGLPKDYKTDLEIDLNTVSKPRWEGYDFVLVLRDQGSQVVPIMGLVDPFSITGHIGDRTARFYHLVYKTCSIKEVSGEEASRLAQAMPPLARTWEKQHQLLEKLITDGCHGIFTQPKFGTDWLAWAQWFEFNSANQIAPRYIRDALRKFNKSQP